MEFQPERLPCAETEHTVPVSIKAALAPIMAVLPDDYHPAKTQWACGRKASTPGCTYFGAKRDNSAVLIAHVHSHGYFPNKMPLKLLDTKKGFGLRSYQFLWKRRRNYLAIVLEVPFFARKYLSRTLDENTLMGASSSWTVICLSQPQSCRLYRPVLFAQFLFCALGNTCLHWERTLLL